MTAPVSPSTSINETLGHIAAEPIVWVRLAATRKALGAAELGGWEQMMLDLVSGEAPPNWEGLYWRYPAALFIASEQRGDVVARWLEQGWVNLYGADVALPSLMEPISWERRDSLASSASYQRLLWPTTATTFGGQAAGQDTGTGVLVEDGPPSFPSFYSAASYVFNVAKPIGGGRATASPAYRHQDTSIRINRVQIVPHEDQIKVEIEGSDLEGAVVELSGDVPGPSAVLGSGVLQVIDLPIAGAVPDGALVLVRRGGRWLDRRSLTRQYGRDEDPGVEYIDDPTNRLQAFIAGREGPNVDFKEVIPHQKDVHSILQCMKSVAAFANGDGGVLLYGVNNQEEIIGISSDALDGTTGRLTRLVSSWVDPRPRVTYEAFPIDGEESLVVLGMHVESGPDVPYMAGEPDHNKIVYIRHYSDSVPARPHEIQRIVQSRAPADTGGGLFGGKRWSV